MDNLEGNRKLVEEYNKICDILRGIRYTICDYSVGRYPPIPSIEDIVDDKDMLIEIGNSADILKRELDYFKSKGYPKYLEICSRQLSITDEDINFNKEFEKKLNYIFPQKGIEYNIFRDSLCFIRLMHKDDNNFIKIESPDNPNYCRFCVLERYIQDNTDFKKVKSIIDKIHTEDYFKNKIRNRIIESKGDIELFSTYLAALGTALRVIAHKKQVSKKIINLIREINHNDKKVTITQADILAQEYKNHTRLLSSTLPKEEWDIEKMKFIKESAKRHKEFTPDGIEKLIDVTGVDPSLLYHCIKDSRGSITSAETAYFKDKYTIS